MPAKSDEQQRVEELFAALQRALAESFRIREAAEDLQQAAARLVRSTTPERRSKPRPLKATLKRPEASEVA